MRALSFVKDASISLAVALALFLVLELGFRWLAPQFPKRVDLDGRPAALADSVLGHVYAPNARVLHTSPEFRVEYHIDSLGHRHGGRSVTPTDTSATRVLLLGDSFTFGASVNDEDTWAAVAGRRLAGTGHSVGMTNAGVEAYDTRSEVLYLERLLPIVEPQVVMLAFLPNDLFTNEPLESNDLDRGVTTGARGAALPRLHTLEFATRRLLSIDRLYAKMYLITARREYFTLPKSDRLTRQMELTRDLLHRAARLCREHGARLVVLSIPQEFQVIVEARGFALDGIDTGFIDEELSAFAERDGFAWVQTRAALVEAYRDSGTDMFFRRDGHLTPAGCRVVAERAASALDPVLGELTR